MPGNHEVFISYSSQDQKLGDSICNYLEEKDISCFIASRDIISGRTYPEEIMKAISNCRYMIVVLTKKSNTSDNVRNEIERAFNLKKAIILFRTENVALSPSLEYFFATFQWLEAIENAPSVYFEKLYCAIKELPPPPLPRKIIISKKILANILVGYLIITILLFCSLGIPILRDYRYVAQKNKVGISLIEKLRSSGLTDIDNKSSNPMPPRYFYQAAQKEIFIAGVTNRYTMENYLTTLDSAMKRGVKVKFLCLNPFSKDTVVIHGINGRSLTFSSEFRTLVNTIADNHEIFKNQNFSIRFVENLPSFIGIMIDGDIDNIKAPDDKKGMIRVVPYLRSDKHNDWIFQFSKNISSKSAYDDYSQEFRHIWTTLAKPHPEYFL